MVVINAHRTTAIVIRHDGHKVMLVPMKSGRLQACRTTRANFEVDWQLQDYPLTKALDSFLEHARQQGATGEAQRGLNALAVRDRSVIRPLF